MTVYTDLFHTVKTSVSLPASSLSAGQVSGNTIDRQGMKALMLSYQLGTKGTGGTLVLSKIKEADKSDFSDAVELALTDERVQGTVSTLSTAGTSKDVGILLGNKRYIKPFYTVAGSAASVVSAVSVLGGADVLPIQE